MSERQSGGPSTIAHISEGEVEKWDDRLATCCFGKSTPITSTIATMEARTRTTINSTFISPPALFAFYFASPSIRPSLSQATPGRAQPEFVPRAIADSV